MEDIYKIYYDHEHVSDAEYDAFVVPFEGSDFFLYDLFDQKEFNHPDLIYLRGDFEVLNNIDYLVTDLDLPIFSKRMISILKSLGSFKHRTILCGITDFTISPKDSYDDFENSVVKSGIEVNRDFEILHLLEVLDILDWDKSDLLMSKRKPDRLSFIKKYAFKIPEEGYPPIFRLKEEISCLFIPESTKNAFDTAGIKGISYMKIRQ